MVLHYFGVFLGGGQRFVCAERRRGGQPLDLLQNSFFTFLNKILNGLTILCLRILITIWVVSCCMMYIVSVILSHHELRNGIQTL